jgi:hypothetical protein
VRKSKNKNPQNSANKGFKSHTVSPSPAVFHLNGRSTDPENLKREISTPAQRNWAEGTILYGEDDALPLRIAQAVEESPAASSCIDTIAQFIKGSQFSDEDLMTFVIDKNGTTLWDFHCALAESLALFWGFAVNFKFNERGKITMAYQMSFESCRLKEPGEQSPYITHIKYNPYFGTAENKKDYTKSYPVFNIQEATKQISNLEGEERKNWGGQVYYFGKTSPLHRFYPVPKYWSAKEAIQADHKLQEFTNQELENGFFQSVLINAIGDPNKWSNNPRLMEDELQSDNVTKKKVPTKTVGEEFNEQMGTSFAGSQKAGTAMVLWSNDANSAIKISPFPSGINGDRLIATQNSITKTITIATRVPSILANISEGVSLGSDGNEIQKSIELMQSRTAEWREVLQNFYNNILLPNLDKSTKGRVEIQNFNPITEPIEIEDKFWEFMNEEERVAFIKKNMPEIEIIRTAAPAQPPPIEPVIDPGTGEEVPPVEAPITASDPNQDALDSLIRSLSRKELSKFYGYVNDFRKGRASMEQTKIFLRAYKLTDEQIMLFLNDEV